MRGTGASPGREKGILATPWEREDSSRDTDRRLLKEPFRWRVCCCSVFGDTCGCWFAVGKRRYVNFSFTGLECGWLGLGFWFPMPRLSLCPMVLSVRLGDVFGTVTNSTLDPDGVCPV
jgi:hypothetical protein